MLTNLFSDLSASPADEQCVELLAHPRGGLRIERIVSRAHASPPGFWYDAPHGEWVIVISGEACLRFEDEAEPRVLAPGAFVDIAPHRRHRVESTHATQPTVWLAVHYGLPPCAD